MELADAARALFEAPFVVLAHDKFVADEPVFTYANQARRCEVAQSVPGVLCAAWRAEARVYAAPPHEALHGARRAAWPALPC